MKTAAKNNGVLTEVNNFIGANTDRLLKYMFPNASRNSITQFKGLQKSMSCRCFSAQQAAAALRPFYFAVHPDRFARDPVVRSKNEKALQV